MSSAPPRNPVSSSSTLRGGFHHESSVPLVCRERTGLFVGGLRAFTYHSSDRSTQTRHALLRECGLWLSRLTFLCVSVTCGGCWIIRVAGTGSADECRGWNAGTAPARPSPSVTESVTVPTSHRALRQEPRPRGSKRRLACGHPRHPCVASRLPAPCT